MEAATPLLRQSIRVAGDRLHVDGVVVDDACAARLVREREQVGEDGVALVRDAIEIGARVLDREQAGASADVVRLEMEKATREVEQSFTARAREVGERLTAQLETVFGPESGLFTKALERHFSDDSSGAVQHRVRALVAEVMQQSRVELLQQFSTADGKNPLADFKAGTLSALNRAASQQDENLRALLAKLTTLELEVQKLRSEREKQLELAEEAERGTAKGRSFEEAVFEALDALATSQGDDCDAVGDQKGATGKVGDVVVAIDACNGPPRGRIVFEAKNSKLSKPEALRQLDAALDDRDADFAVLVVPSEDKLPARTTQLREHNGDKLLVAYDPDEGSTLALQVAYSLARARVLMARGDADGLDAAAMSDTLERAIASLGEVRKVKSQLTGATTSIATARELLETMERAVRDQLEQLQQLLAAGRATTPAE